MSFTATGIAPTSLYLDVYPSNFEAQKRAPELHTDEEDAFLLDMVTMDMDFEQAYAAYTQMQQKDALVGIENLQKLKSQSQQAHSTSKISHGLTKSVPADSDNSKLPYSSEQQNHHTLQQNHCHSHVNGYYDSIPGLPLLLPPNEMVTSAGSGLFCDGKTANPVAQQTKETSNIDHFFLNTESDALEKFLDNMALSSNNNPLDFYNNQPSAPNGRLMLDMHTMDPTEEKSQTQREIPDYIKKEITDAFRHPPVQSLKSFGSADPITLEEKKLSLAQPVNTQLPTPMDSRQVSSASCGDKRSSSAVEEEEGLQSPPWSPTLGQRRRSLTKPLLSLEQKRLNHLHSEQKRRLLCKQAYERCLRLITNVDDYKYDLVSASAATSSKKKSKRKQINKDGLPNLSKHTALLKVSGEIIKIRNKNEQLRKLIERS